MTIAGPSDPIDGWRIAESITREFFTPRERVVAKLSLLTQIIP